MSHRSRITPLATAVGIALGLADALGAAPPLRAQEAAPGAPGAPADSIPLPEHPRPDFERPQWMNLNGRWGFRFDRANEGERGGWFRSPLAATHTILVPFPWGSPLSGVPDSAELAWY